ncbi:MAG: DUF362 domain-containing protein [Thermodesulfobacteriota bacterium]|nr:DUF362 domain-containing protein [Thermodesulfobacteriota bacterium]
MASKTVFTRKLHTPHQSESFTKYLPLNREQVREIRSAVKEIFDAFGGKDLIKSSGNVYIKPNGIDAKPYCYTRPELIRAVIEYWYDAGAGKVYLLENSTQANYTRIVFKSNGYKKVCTDTAAIPIYLDEEQTITYPFTGKKSMADGDADGYDLTTFEMPVTVVKKLIEKSDENLYINLPKLKTHSMTGVTLGIKNQWGFPAHQSRGLDHNYHLHGKLIDMLSYIKPDVTLIEGVEGSIYGHYPALNLADECIKPFGLLIGSKNVVAADLVGAKLFGLEKEDVPHLQMAIDRGFGGDIRTLQDIDMAGDITHLDSVDLIGDMPEAGSYPTDLFDSFPGDVTIIQGKELACKEGCVNNPLTLLQVLYNDYNGRGGWTLLMGKGFDKEEILKLEGKVLIAGHCAIEEVSSILIKKLTRKNVYLSGECNDLCSTAEAMFHLMKVNPIDLIPLSSIAALVALITAKLKGSHSRVPSPWSHILKGV